MSERRQDAYRLARQCGVWDVDSLIDGITPEIFAEWREFFRSEHDTAVQRDRPLATILAALAAMWGHSIDIDDQLRAWDHNIPLPPFDPAANARAILSAFGA